MFKIKDKSLALLQYLIAALLIAMLVLQACSKKMDVDPGPGGNPNPGETETMKLIPDSMFREYLKANVCPDAFDKTGKFIDITSSQVKNFTGTMSIDTINCPFPYVSSLKGIEYFNKMTKLIVTSGPLDSLNLTKTMALDTVKLVGMRDLQYVNVAGLNAMRYFRASRLPVVSLDLSNLNSLEYIYLENCGRLDDLKTSNSTNLRHLMTFGLTALKSVDLSSNPNLLRLYYEYGYNINSIDVTKNRKIREIFTSFCTNLKSIDLSKNDSLRVVGFDDSKIDSIDFSHNPELISVVMLRTPVRNLSFLSNPKLHLLYLDGCALLNTVDLRAQTSFDYFFWNRGTFGGISEDLIMEKVQTGRISIVQDADHPLEAKATRKGVNGATTNLFGGLRLPQYLDVNAISLTNVKVSDAIKDNYSLVMARRVLGSQQPALITVYAEDKTTVLCNDYSPELFKCN
jgi:hypothetical protein